MDEARLQLTTGEVLPITIAEFNANRKLPTGHKLSAVCMAPFNNIDFDPTGAIRVCNHSGERVAHINDGVPILEIWRGPAFAKLRQQFLEYKLPKDHCIHCVTQCRTGPGAYTFAVDHFDRGAHDDANPLYPRQLIFRLGSTCNLACVMCDGDTSSRIRKERDGLPLLPDPYPARFYDEMREILPHIEYAEFYGGEPFLIPGHRRIFKLLQELNPSCQIYVNTNNAVLTPEIEDLLQTLNFVHIAVSMDASSDKTHRLVRKGIKHEQFVKNLDRLQELQKTRGFRLNLNVTEHRKNWFELPQIFQFAERRGIDIHINICIYPYNVTLYTLPTAELHYVHHYLQRWQTILQNEFPRWLNQNSYRVLLRQIEAELGRRHPDWEPPPMTRINRECDGLLATPWPGLFPLQTPDDLIAELDWIKGLPPNVCKRFAFELIYWLERIPDAGNWLTAVDACKRLL